MTNRTHRDDSAPAWMLEKREGEDIFYLNALAIDVQFRTRGVLVIFASDAYSIEAIRCIKYRRLENKIPQQGFGDRSKRSGLKPHSF